MELNVASVPYSAGDKYDVSMGIKTNGIALFNISDNEYIRVSLTSFFSKSISFD